MRRYLIIGLFFLTGTILTGQSVPQNYFQGYVEEEGGMRFGYHSPIPTVTTSLLLRGREDFSPIEWITEVVPRDYTGRFVTYIWLFGMDVTSTPVDFDLLVNGRRWFSFSSSKTSELGLRTIAGPDGATLTFNVTMLDKYSDQMGFAILKLPIEAIIPGESSSLKLRTSTAYNDAWFMTFKTRVEEEITLYQNKVVTRSEDALWHSISADFVYIGDDAPVSVTVGETKVESVLKAGFNKLEINLPKVEDTTGFIAEIRIADRTPVRRQLTLAPVREWEIFLVQHTHTDIGYTRPQTEILPEHLRYIDNALDFCDQTDGYPDAAKFRWTCETSWSVREYLKSRPQAQVDRLLRRVREGRIEATGMFLNFSEIIDEPALVAQTRTLRMLKNSGIDVTTAMQNDVNGIAWCLVDYFHDTDVKYLNMGIHAHRARKPFDMPTPFWWQSPAGNRLLAYRSEHYQHANSLSLTTGQQDVFRANLSQYLAGLEEKGYPYDKVALQFSGYLTDNSPPSTKACAIIKAWNEKYAWPKLHSALARDFLLYLDEQHASEIPTLEVSWPDWWTDGVASAANETKVARHTQVDIAATTAVLSMTKTLGMALPDGYQLDIDAVYDDLLFYNEHTHGAAESISDPLALNTVNQWGMKSAYAWDAAKRAHQLEEKALAFMEPALHKASLPTIAVFNTLNWTRSGMADLFVLYEVIPEGVDFTITDADGREVPAQAYQRRQEGMYYRLWVEDIPPLGFKTLQVNVGPKGSLLPASDSASFENEFYQLDIDARKGVVTRIFDKDLQIELIDPADTMTLGKLIYEQLKNRHALERLTNTNRDTFYSPLDLTRSTLRDIEIVKRENGAIYHSIYLHGDLPICADERGVDIEIRLYHHQKKIDFHYRMFKLPITDPEGVYVAFPFQLDGGKLAFEVQGGVVYPGVNQLQRTSSDWNTIQNFAAVRNDKAQIVFVSHDIPLVHFGDLNIGRYYYRLKPKTSHIYSWVLNNYWVTNFKASQQGELRWMYSMTSDADNSDLFATRFGWGERAPLLTRILLPTVGVETTRLVSRSVIDLDVPGLLLVQTAPSLDGKGIILHVREVVGKPATLDIKRLAEDTDATGINVVNVLEEEMAQLTSALELAPYETKFIKVIFE